MTALATIFALTPMGLGITGHGGFISQPLAIVVIGGLISSTLLTLLVLPTLYNLVEGARERREARRRAGAGAGAEVGDGASGAAGAAGGAGGVAAAGGAGAAGGEASATPMTRRERRLAEAATAEPTHLVVPVDGSPDAPTHLVIPVAPDDHEVAGAGAGAGAGESVDSGEPETGPSRRQAKRIPGPSRGPRRRRLA
jgi:HAE1 family hydrophobic/amphiphilic exporter-1